MNLNAAHVCRHLRSKSMYIPALTADPGRETGEQSPRSGHCWCNVSLTEVGPDDKPVGPDVCRAARPCFED